MYYYLPHDGTCEGDNNFSPIYDTPIPSVENPTLKYLKENFKPSYEEFSVEAIKGAWIVDDRLLEILVALRIPLSMGLGSTSDYSINYAAKVMLNETAKGFVGKKPNEDYYSDMGG